MLTRRAALFSAAAAATLMLSAPSFADDLKLPRQKVDLVAPPFVHAHEQATKQSPRIMEFKLVIEEKKVVIDEKGTTFQAMTFNGSMPGPLMVVHEGDYVEVTLVNPAANSMPHNIDFHSATGALGGGALTLVNPGEQVVLRWKATRTGTFVYHCAPGGPMIPWHVVSGMNGAVMVLPRDEKGNFKSYDSPGEAYTDTEEVMRKLTPTHVVFNGKVGALTGKNALTANVGETVLIVHSQANRDSRPHLIGGHGDYVWETGKFSNPPETGLETWFIRGGSAGAAMYKFLQPGIYAYVTHNLIEAADLGATAHFKVEGKWNDDLMTQVKAPAEIPPATN